MSDGRPGARLLGTVLSSRTLPLIRYELTDRVRLSTERRPCGRPFRLVAGIEGRTDDVLELPASTAARWPCTRSSGAESHGHLRCDI